MQQMPPPPRFAGFWIRFLAWIIDMVIFILLIFTIIGWALYFPLMYWKKGQTVGMMVVGVRIVRGVDGGPITGQMAFIRFLVFAIEMVIIVGFLGCVWAAFEPRKRAIHDMAAGTVVIHTT